MRKSFTAVLERNSTFTEDFTTEPYEVGWASEARWFVRALELNGAGTHRLRLVTQLSPDGLVWVDDDQSAETYCTGPGMLTWPVREFGHWMRLRAVLEGADASTKVLIYLALKS
jgi:hypothetical protein